MGKGRKSKKEEKAREDRVRVLSLEWRGVFRLFPHFISGPRVRWLEVSRDVATYYFASIHASDTEYASPLVGIMQITEGFVLPKISRRTLPWGRIAGMENPGLEWRRFARLHCPRLYMTHIPLIILNDDELPPGYSEELPVALPVPSVLRQFFVLDKTLSERVRYAFCRGRVSLLLGDHASPPRIIYDADPEDRFLPRPTLVDSLEEYAEGGGRVLLPTALQAHADLREILFLANHPVLKKVHCFARWGRM